MKRIFLLLFAALMIMPYVQAEKVSVYNPSEGYLKDKITNDLTTITELDFERGSRINAKDLYFIAKNMPNLEVLDFSANAISFVVYKGAIEGVSDDAGITYPENEIPKEVFKGHSNLTTVKISEVITSIGKGAFQDCAALTVATRISWGGTLTIGAYAFAGTGITSIDGNNTFGTIGSLGQYAFSGCAQLSEVKLPKELTALEEGVFAGCTSLTRIQLVNVQKIGKQVFQNCTSLSLMRLPEGVQSIGERAFEGAGFTRLELPASLSSLHADAFKGLLSVKEFYVSATTPVAADASAFSDFNKANCTLYVPAGAVTNYTSAAGWNYFAPNIQEKKPVITTVTPGTLQDKFQESEYPDIIELNLSGSINAQDIAFIRKNLTELITLDMSAVSITYYKGTTVMDNNEKEYLANALPDNGLRNLLNLKSLTLPTNLVEIGEYALNANTSLSALSIPKTVTEIRDGAFARTGLVSIEIPASVDTLRSFVFNNCNSLTSLKLNEGLKVISSNAIYSSSLPSLTLPNSLEKLEDNAIEGSFDAKLETLTFGTGLKSIGASALILQVSIKELVLPEGLEKIGEYAFGYLTSLKKLSLPSTLTVLPYDVLYLDEGKYPLTEIYSYSAEPLKIDATTFDLVDTKNCILWVPAGSVEKYKADNADGWNKFLDIRPMGSAGINEVRTQLPVHIQNGNIIVTTESGNTVEVYNALGFKLQSQIANSTETTLSNLPKGQVLIVRCGNAIAKVIL